MHQDYSPRSCKRALGRAITGWHPYLDQRTRCRLLRFRIWHQCQPFTTSSEDSKTNLVVLGNSIPITSYFPVPDLGVIPAAHIDGFRPRTDSFQKDHAQTIKASRSHPPQTATLRPESMHSFTYLYIEQHMPKPIRERVWPISPSVSKPKILNRMKLPFRHRPKRELQPSNDPAQNRIRKILPFAR
jgi:hypothetical protein